MARKKNAGGKTNRNTTSGIATRNVFDAIETQQRAIERYRAALVRPVLVKPNAKTSYEKSLPLGANSREKSSQRRLNDRENALTGTVRSDLATTGPTLRKETDGKHCKARPDSKKARNGSGGSRTFVPWCKRT